MVSRISYINSSDYLFCLANCRAWFWGERFKLMEHIWLYIQSDAIWMSKTSYNSKTWMKGIFGGIPLQSPPFAVTKQLFGRYNLPLKWLLSIRFPARKKTGSTSLRWLETVSTWIWCSSDSITVSKDQHKSPSTKINIKKTTHLNWLMISKQKKQIKLRFFWLEKIITI